MNPRIEYEMAETDLKELLAACRPTPVMFLGGGVPLGRSPQENANDAWRVLGEKMGFDSMTVRPSEKGQRFFTAVPSETGVQKNARFESEAEENRQKKIAHLEKIVSEATTELSRLKGNTHGMD